MNKPNNWDAMSKADQDAFVAKYKLEKGGKPPWLDEEDGEEGAAKSVAVEDLVKSMDKIDELAKAATPESRKQDLLRKSLDGAATADEQLELAGLLKGDKPAGGVAEDLTKALTDGDDLQKSIDVSGALSDLVGNLEKALGAVGEHIEHPLACRRKSFGWVTGAEKGGAHLGRLERCRHAHRHAQHRAALGQGIFRHPIDQLA